ncbi:MAG TPA: DUF3267 domain-containing protein [Candidatus Limnocylindrales bacterium]|nr:DUF3267 domain-containing protein [Candidatus Limnocylindrales bacterium]
MLALRSLPSGYVLSGTLRLRGNRKLWLMLTLLSVPWTVVSFVSIGWLASVVRPEGWTFDGRESSVPAVLGTIVGGLLATGVITIVLHEAVHGILLWMFTRERPTFGFMGWYAYADAPGWYFQRWPMAVVLVAPLIVLPAIGLPLIAFAPPAVSIFVLFGLIINSIAAIADLYSIVVVLRIRGPVYFGDTPGGKPGESGSWYLPGK